MSEDPFDAWDERAFQEWQSCRYLESLWWNKHDHAADALRYMFAAMDEDEIKTVTGFTRVMTIRSQRIGKSLVQQAMLDQARLTGAMVEKIGDTGAVKIWWDEDREIQFEHIEARDLYDIPVRFGYDPGFEMIDPIDDIRDGIYKVQAEPTLPKRIFAPKRHDTNPRSPRDTMRARRGR